MPRIASHHLQEHQDNPDQAYSPTQAWLDDTMVQWGGNGIVLGKHSYSTAFFEAFPAGEGFIRGEGKTIAEAEEAAFKQWQKEHGCTHSWGRQNYTNGGAICRHCKGFGSKVFHPIVTLGRWRQPIDRSDLENIISGWLRVRKERDIAQVRKYSHERYLKAKVAGIDLPKTPKEPMSTKQFMSWERDPYRESCREAVAEWLTANEDQFSDHDCKRLWRNIQDARAADARL